MFIVGAVGGLGRLKKSDMYLFTFLKKDLMALWRMIGKFDKT